MSEQQAEQATLKPYGKSDMVDVVDGDGNAIQGLPQVPKAWLSTSLVPPGTKKGKPKSDGDDSSGSSDPARPARQPGEEPAGNASTAEWVAYAREKGAKDDDLLDDKAEPLSRDELRAKYGTPPSS